MSEFAAHLSVCGWEEVECPCPGCDEWMARAKLEEHLAASGAVQLQRAWKRVEKLEEGMKELHKRAEVTRVFTWSTDSACSDKRSLSDTFSDGVSGHCRNWSGQGNTRYSMGFGLEEGKKYTMHFDGSILDNLSAADQVGSVRADGSIKLHMAVHFYLQPLPMTRWN